MLSKIKKCIFSLGRKNTFIKKCIYKCRMRSKWKYRLSDKKVCYGEQSFEACKRVVNDAARKHPGAVSRMKKLCSEQIAAYRTHGKFPKSNEDTVTDMLFCYMAYGTSPDEYLLFDFANLSPRKRREYITDMNRFEFYYRVNDPNDEKVLFDKYKTACMYKKFYNRDFLKVTDATPDDKIVSFISKHGSFVRKPLNESRGQGVELCTEEINSDEQLLKIRSCQPCMLEELVIQSAEMAVLHPESVNTVRCITINNGGNTDTVLFHPVLRMGRGNSFVDNAAAGGIIANIDADTGTVVTDGVDEAGNTYKKHPDSQINISGFKVPQWEELKEFARKISQIMPSVRYVGWDLALTDNGWVMIEGNCHGQFLCEYVDKIGRKKELSDLINRS